MTGMDPDLENRPLRMIAVYGALRSGTTLLRLMLDANPGLSCPGETDFIFDHLGELSPSWAYDEDILESDRIYRSHREKYKTAPLPNPTPDRLIRRIAGEDAIAVLMLHRNISLALALYPDLRIVHVLRDPRDVARSSIGMGWAGNVFYGIDHWIETEREWQDIVGKLTADQFLSVHYESLIDHPERTLTEICDFARCRYHPAMLEYDKTSSYAKPSADFGAQWKRKQSSREIGLVEAKIGHLLTASGYEPSGVRPHHPSMMEKAILLLGNKGAQWKSRIRRYGILDPFVVVLGRKLGSKKLAAAAKRRIDEKSLKYLK